MIKGVEPSRGGYQCIVLGAPKDNRRNVGQVEKVLQLMLVALQGSRYKQAKVPDAVVQRYRRPAAHDDIGVANQRYTIPSDAVRSRARRL